MKNRCYIGLTQSCRIPIIYKVENINVDVKQSSKCLWKNVKDDTMPQGVGKTLTDYFKGNNHNMKKVLNVKLKVIRKYYIRFSLNINITNITVLWQ